MNHFDKQALFWASTVFTAVVVSSVLMFLQSFQVGLVSAVIVIAIAVAFKYPRWGLWLLLIYLPFEGTVTYSIGSVYQAVGGRIVYSVSYFLFPLIKEAFYYPALISLILSAQMRKLQPKIKSLLIALFALLGVCLGTLLGVNLPQQLEAGPNESPFLMGIIGLKILMGYIPLLLCAHSFIRDRQDLLRLTRLQVVILLVCCSLCWVQYWLLVSGVCAGNSELPDPAFERASLQAHCFVGGSLLYNPKLELLRLPGTFVSPWQWGWFLISGSFFAYGSFVSDPSRRWRSLSLAAIVLLLATTIISGQRVALLFVPIILLVLLWLTEEEKKHLPLKLGVIAFLGAVVFNEIQLVRDQLVDFVDRWQYSPPPQFMAEQLGWIFDHHLSWLGSGLGRASSAARGLGEIQLIEVFHARLLYEIGILGAIAFLVVVTILTTLTFNAYRSLQNPSLRRLGFCVWVFILLISYNPYYYPLAVDPVAVYYWFFAGVLLKLPELEQTAALLTPASVNIGDFPS